MAVQILPDLHLEAQKTYDIFEIVPKAPYLALLGDTCNITLHKDDYIAFLMRQLKQFRAVLLVPGNHEAYYSEWPEILKILRTFEQDVRKNTLLGNFFLLDRGVFQLPDASITILGCSVFSSISRENEEVVSFGLNDFFHIKGWDTSAHNEAHVRDVAWLNVQVSLAQETKITILSHWSPSTDSHSMDPKHMTSLIGSDFPTDLSDQLCFMSNKVKVWAFGHTHYNCDYTVERQCDAEPLRLLSNQRVYYYAQAEGFNGGEIVEL